MHHELLINYANYIRHHKSLSLHRNLTKQIDRNQRKLVALYEYDTVFTSLIQLK